MTLKLATKETISSPVLLLFLTIFSFTGHFLGFILVGKVFEKAFRILE